MTPLDIVDTCPQPPAVAALRSQRMSLGAYLYLFAKQSHTLRAGRQRVAKRQAGQNRPVWTFNNEWRTRCPRASNHSSQSGLLPWLQPVAKTSRWKNTLWSTLSRSPASRPTPANTSKAKRLTGEQAARPVHTRTHLSAIRGDVA